MKNPYSIVINYMRFEPLILFVKENFPSWSDFLKKQAESIGISINDEVKICTNSSSKLKT